MRPGASEGSIRPSGDTREATNRTPSVPLTLDSKPRAAARSARLSRIPRRRARGIHFADLRVRRLELLHVDRPKASNPARIHEVW
jgi:hypothetical protein